MFRGDSRSFLHPPVESKIKVAMRQMDKERIDQVFTKNYFNEIFSLIVLAGVKIMSG